MSDATSRTDVTEVVDQGGISGLQWWVICICTIVIVLDGFDVQAIAFAAPAIARDYQIATSAMGPILGAGLVGMALGALILGPFGDIYGRKAAIGTSVSLFGVMTLLTALAGNEQQLIILRFLTGLGLGGALPNATALMTEYAPRRLRNLMISVIFVGFPLGGIVGGMIAAEIIPRFGWQSLFIVGGILPLIVAAIVFAAMPESIRFLVMKKPGKHAALVSILNRIDRGRQYGVDEDFRLAEQAAPAGRFIVRHLFDKGYGRDTVLLWIVFFVNLMEIYFLISWIPSLLVDAAFTLVHATQAAVVLNLGGAVGPLVLAWLTARFGTRRMLCAFYLLGAASVALIGQIPLPGANGAVAPAVDLGIVLASTFLAGFFVFGAQIGMNALAASIYPTFVRSTGIGWALGIGRLGSILGPLVGGMLLGMSLGMPAYFFIFGAVLIVAMIGVALIRRQ